MTKNPAHTVRENIITWHEQNPHADANTIARGVKALMNRLYPDYYIAVSVWRDPDH